MSHTSHTHNHHNNNNKNEELYVNVQSPDNRKRFTIYNESDNSSAVLMVPDNIKYSALLGLIINKFQLDSSIRNKLRVKNDMGTRIKKLDNTFNNQILRVSISDLEDNEPEEDIGSDISNNNNNSNNNNSNSKSLAEEYTYLPLFKEEKENKNLFYKFIIKPLITNPERGIRLVIGESYPYRIKIIISIPLVRSRAYLYFTEIVGGTELAYDFNIVLDAHQADQKLVLKDFELLVSNEISSSKSNINNIVFSAYQYFLNNTTSFNPSTTQKTTSLLFPDLIQAETQPQNALISSIYQEIEKVSKFNNIPESLAKKLLFSNSFNSKALLKGRGRFVGLNHPFKTSNIALFKFNNNQKPLDETLEYECSICYCDYSIVDMVELICGHSFCKHCLKSYFQSSIYDGNDNKVSCPSLGCLNKCIDEVTVESLVQNSSLQKIRLRNLVNDYIYSVPGTIMCPTSNCGRLLFGIKSTSKYAPYVHCGNHDFCIFCKKSGLHWPSACSNFKPKIVDDLFSYKWIIDNCTICPSCKNSVERTQGCNHMVCKCKHEFCYVCGDNWKHICRGFDQKLKHNFQVVRNNNAQFSSTFLENFFSKMSNKTNGDKVINHLVESLVTLIGKTKDSSSNELIEKAIYALNGFISGSKHKVDLSSSTTQQIFKKLLRPDVTLKINFGSNYFDKMIFENQNQPSTRSLSASICINGQKKSLFKVFVNSQFFDFKLEIATQLNKYIQQNQQPSTPIELYDAKKLRIFNQYGGQIKCSNEILDLEALFITHSIGEPFVEPVLPTLTQAEIDQVNREIEKEKENQVEILFNNTTKLFTKLQQKSKRKQDKSKLLENEVNQLKLQEQLKLDHQNNGSNQSSTHNSNKDHYQIYYKSNVNNEEDQYYRNYDYTDDDDDDDLHGSGIVDECQDNVNHTSNSSISEDEMFDFVNMDSCNSSSDFDTDTDDQVDMLQVEKEQKEIEMVIKVLEIFKDDQENCGLDFEKVYSVCHSAKNLSHAISLMNKYLDESVYQYQYKFNQTHILMKEILADYYPNVSHHILDRSLFCTNYNLDRAKSWILNKYLKQEEKKQLKQMKSIEKEKELYKQDNIPTHHQQPVSISPKYQQDIYDQDDCEDYEEYEEYEDYLSTTLHSRYSKFN